MYPSTHPPVFSPIHLIIPSPPLHPPIHHSIHSYFLMSILSHIHPFTNPSLSSPRSYLLFYPPTHPTSHVCIHIPVHLTNPPPLVSLGTVLPQLHCLSLTSHCGGAVISKGSCLVPPCLLWSHSLQRKSKSCWCLTCLFYLTSKLWVLVFFADSD